MSLLSRRAWQQSAGHCCRGLSRLLHIRYGNQQQHLAVRLRHRRQSILLKPSLSRGMSTDGAAAGIRQAHIAAAPRIALQQTFTARARNLGSSGSELPSQQSLQQVEEILGHSFHNQWLLRLALVHSSAYNYTGSSNLAWLGDSALYLTVSEQLAATYSNAEAGELSIARARLISRETCQQRAKQLELDQHWVVGKSIKANPQHTKDHLIAELFEAVLGAVYVDGGLDSVRAVYVKHFPLPASIRHINKPPLDA